VDDLVQEVFAGVIRQGSTLRNAQAPVDYSDTFVDLGAELQDEIIARTEQQAF
jgi:hypothetical protein